MQESTWSSIHLVCSCRRLASLVLGLPSDVILRLRSVSLQRLLQQFMVQEGWTQPQVLVVCQIFGVLDQPQRMLERE